MKGEFWSIMLRVSASKASATLASACAESKADSAGRLLATTGAENATGAGWGAGAA
jgi:hypothetical protein